MDVFTTTMKRTLVILVVLASGCATQRCGDRRGSDPGGWSAEGTLVRVVDGDTVVVMVHGVEETVRVRGIDCPEASPNSKCRRDGDCETDIPLGKVATARAEALLPADSAVRLVSPDGAPDRDRYGRLLAYVEREDIDLGLELVREGRCVDFSHKYPHPRAESYLEATPGE